MAGINLYCYALLISTCQLLHGALWASAAPTTDLATTVVSEITDNGSGDIEEWARTDSENITETPGNESTNNTDELYFRSSWTIPKTQEDHENYESEEGWLNGGLISKDVLIPYRAFGVWDRFGNDPDDWKKYLVKPSDENEQGRVPRIEHNVKQKSPFDYYTHLWKKLANTTPKTT